MRTLILLFSASLWGQSVVPVLTSDQMTKLLALLNSPAPTQTQTTTVQLTTTDPARLIWTFPSAPPAGAKVVVYQKIPVQRIGDTPKIGPTSLGSGWFGKWTLESPTISGATLTLLYAPPSDGWPVLADITQ